MQDPNWSTNDISDQSGKTAIVTGATSGIGKETARVLAGKGAKVILAVRNTVKGRSVADDIRKSLPQADIFVRRLDLASLSSVKAFADSCLQDEARLDILVNNAGVMFPPYTKTEDGFELQMGTNHLGHFALAGRLLPLLKATHEIEDRGRIQPRPHARQDRLRGYAVGKAPVQYPTSLLRQQAREPLLHPRIGQAA